MYELTATLIQEWINSKAVVLRFAVEPPHGQQIISLEMLIDGEYHKRFIGLELPMSK